MQGGTAIAEILVGDINPSGKLTTTFTRKLNNYPIHSMGEFPGYSVNVTYKYEIWVGYRYFDSFTDYVLFLFGHGLS